jgi:hypothetical protein
MRRIFLIATMVLSAVTATAAQLDTSVGGQVEYDDNVLRSSTDKRDDVIFRLYPEIALREDHGEDLNYSLDYRMPFSLAVQNDAVNGLDHVAKADATYRPSDRVQLGLTDSLTYLRSTLLTPEDIGFGPEITTQRQRFLRNRGQLSGRYLFTPRLSGDAEVIGDYFNPLSRKDRSENYGVTGLGDLSYVINAQHTLAGGVALTYQQFLPSTVITGSETGYVNGFLQWTWQFDDQTLIRVGAGPTWIQTHLDTRNILGSLPAGTSLPVVLAALQSQNQNTGGGSVTIFGNALISRRWSPTLITALSYERRQGGASGLGGSVVEDYVYVTGNWDFTERWQLALRGDYVLRQSVETQRVQLPAILQVALAGSSPRATASIDTDRWGVGGRLTHRMTKRFRTYLDVRYNRQTSPGATLGRPTDFSNFIAVLGVDYSFDPVHLW